MSNRNNAINTSFPSNYTVALDENDRILWCSQTDNIGAGYINSVALNATSVIIGTNITELSAAILTHPNITKVYYYNEETKDIIYEGYGNSSLYDKSTNTIYNASGNAVEMVPLGKEGYVFDLYDNYVGDLSYVNVSDFCKKI